MPTPPVGDGVADDHGAVMDYINARIPLPPGIFRITQKLDLMNTAAGVSPGWCVEGTHRMLSTIVADYNETNPNAGIVDIAPNAISKYTYGTSIRNIGFKVASGRSGHSAIALTAAWYVKIDSIHIEGMSAHGIYTPLRADLSPGISDPYQDFAVSVKRSYIRGCSGYGVGFTAGQSPGLYVARHNHILSNYIGIKTTTGQCIINQNVLAENYYGGLAFDTAEGPSMVAEVTQNEIQDNGRYGLNIERSRGLYLSRNRILSRMSGVNRLQQFGVIFGNGLGPGGTSTAEVWSLIAEQNLFRSDISSAGYGFTAYAGTFDKNHPSYFRGTIADVPSGYVVYDGFNFPIDGAVIQN